VKIFCENPIEFLKKSFSLLSLSLEETHHKKKKVSSIFACNFMGKLVKVGWFLNNYTHPIFFSILM